MVRARDRWRHPGRAFAQIVALTIITCGILVQFLKPGVVQGKSMALYLQKRLVGLPGDRVVQHDGKLWVNGRVEIKKSALSFKTTNRVLKNDEYFVVGDNPDSSYDSRAIGPIKREQILGKVIAKIPFIRYPAGKNSPDD